MRDTNEVFQSHQRTLDGSGFGFTIDWISSIPRPASRIPALPTSAKKTFDAGSEDEVEALPEYRTAVFLVGYSLAKLRIS